MIPQSGADEAGSEGAPAAVRSGRIFCLGFQKTGTCSIRAALRQLGISVTGHQDQFIEAIRDRDIAAIDATVERCGAFQDNPWPVLYRVLDERYPGSLFILLVRDEDRWFGSILNHFGVFGQGLMRLTYGRRNPAGNEALYRERYRAHNEEVQAYFRDRPDDFLRMDLSAGDGWPELCRFLGVDLVEGPFPHVNERSYSSFVSWVNKVCTWVVVGAQSIARAIGLGRRDVSPPGSIYWPVEPRLDLPAAPPHEEPR
jgi:hypothetical protein